MSEVRRIYGLLSYFRQFVPDFAQLAAPLAKLLRSDTAPKRWAPEHDRIVSEVLRQLVAHSGLRLPALGRPFVLEVTAFQGYAGVLLQADDTGKERPVACVSTLQTCAGSNEVERVL